MTFIIAEAGVNHNGDFDTAIRLVDAAKATGADAVKFQFFNSRKLWGDDRITHLELSGDQLEDLHTHANATGIQFMCTPFGVEEAKFLKPLVKRMKISSGCIWRYDILDTVSDMPVILSTGMSNYEDIYKALRHLGEVTLLHCTSAYPCRLQDVNLKAMQAMEVEFMRPVGYSDHTSGIVVAIAAAALGAKVIEKHLTLDRNSQGPDHKASINPLEFKAMVVAIREVNEALGNGIKRVLPSEKALREVWRANA